MMSNLSRRKLLTAGLATAGVSGLGVAARLADRYGLIPPDHGGLYGPGKTLTYASQRLLTRHSVAREFSPREISTPYANGRPPKSEDFNCLRAAGFAEWQIRVDGMVTRPGSFLLSQLKKFPSRSQITQLTCEEGWSFIAEGTGLPLAHLLDEVGTLPQAKYVAYFSMQPNRWDSIDMNEAPAQLRHSPAGGRRRSAHHPDAARARRPGGHQHLPASVAASPGKDGQSARTLIDFRTSDRLYHRKRQQ
jgi:hypothetical protein